jgi:hypothetical protein
MVVEKRMFWRFWHHKMAVSCVLKPRFSISSNSSITSFAFPQIGLRYPMLSPLFGRVFQPICRNLGKRSFVYWCLHHQKIPIVRTDMYFVNFSTSSTTCTTSSRVGTITILEYVQVNFTIWVKEVGKQMFYQFLFAQFPSYLPDMITENVLLE